MKSREEICIRPYRDTDWPELSAIHDAARPIELAASGLSDAFLSLAQTAESEGLFDGELWVAERDAQALGFATVCDGELTWLYVHPAHMRQGVATALLAHAFQTAPGAMRTECLVGNDAALALYLREGFRILKRMDGKLTGNESFAAAGYILERPAG